ncbi:MAG: thiamine biosynthesis protein ThiS [Bacteroidetes bacterium QS_8_68_15]|jgi:sulfur carrier protein|nr:MAG: thiamine biosynthesis protein ThiS [Bacteroidetes bacterium QS_8_68_15]
MSTPEASDSAASAPAARVTVNGEDESLPPAGATVAELLRRRDDAGPEQSGIAVAVDGDVVRRQDWSDTHLGGGEHVEIITAQQGG